jgi:glycosyltransferase involved in cell wall biosynthesis
VARSATERRAPFVRVVVVGPIAGSLVNFRGELLRSMAAHGHEVLALAPESDTRVRTALGAMDVAYATVPLHRTGTSPIRDFGTVISLTRTFRRVRPDAVLVYAAKPVIYGSIAARLAGVPMRAAMITGVGSALGAGSGPHKRALSWLMRRLYAAALGQVHVVFFQNPDDERLFRSMGLVGDSHRVVRINGSGVDLEHFSPAPFPPAPITFLMIGRLIRDKGVWEYVDAARLVRRTHPEVRFQLLGPLDSNPSAIPGRQLDAWRDEGIVEYLGTVTDVRPSLGRSHVLVLPSYGEGMPRSVLEAMAMGRPVLTTDVPGCRETVEGERNGYLIPPRDALALADGMVRMLAEPERLEQMGRESRAIVEERFDVHSVNRAILGAMGLD